MPKLSSAELARIALRRIAELRVPPTPENFRRYYQEADGEVPSVAAGGVGPELRPATLQRFDELVGRAVATADHLAAGLHRHDDEFSTSLEALVAEPANKAAAEMFRSLFVMSQDIQATVKSSHDELLETRRSLAEIRAQLNESQKLLAQDPLTGTENRRGMNSILSAEVARARRDSEPLSVVMVDIDHFKSINDTYGHAGGDAALVHFTMLAKSMLRGNDAFIRYGGEEFLLILPETALQGGVSTAQRLQNLLKRQPVQYEGKAIAMTFSGGVSMLAPVDSEESLVRRADSALYEAKNTGRNRIVARTE